MTGDVEGALKYWKKALEMGSESKTLKQKIEKKKYMRNEKNRLSTVVGGSVLAGCKSSKHLATSEN